MHKYMECQGAFIVSYNNSGELFWVFLNYQNNFYFD